MSNNWPAFGEPGISLTAKVSPDPATAINGGAAVREDIMVYNPGPNVVRIFCGDANATAAALSFPVLPYTVVPFGALNCTHISARAEGGDQVINVFRGRGS